MGRIIDTYNDPEGILNTGMNIAALGTAQIEKEYCIFCCSHLTLFSSIHRVHRRNTSYILFMKQVPAVETYLAATCHITAEVAAFAYNVIQIILLFGLTKVLCS